MPDMGVDIDVRADGADAGVRFVVNGEIDLANVVSVERQLHDAITNQARDVVLDLTGVTYLDSAGLRVVLSLAERLRIAQISLQIIAPPRSAARFAIEVSGMAALCGLE